MAVPNPSTKAIIPTVDHVREALAPDELYLRIQATRAVRQRYKCTQQEAGRAIDQAIQSGVLAVKSCIGLQEDTPAYQLSQP